MRLASSQAIAHRPGSVAETFDRPSVIRRSPQRIAGNLQGTQADAIEIPSQASFHAFLSATLSFNGIRANHQGPWLRPRGGEGCVTWLRDSQVQDRENFL